MILLKLLTLTILTQAQFIQGGRTDFQPLLCRGGGDITVSHTLLIPNTTNQSNPNLNKMQVQIEVRGFKPGEAASHPQGLNLIPGTCAWSERPMAANDPTRILFDSEQVPGVSLNIRLQSQAGGKNTGAVSLLTNFSYLTSQERVVKFWVKKVEQDPAYFVLAPNSTIEVFTR